ncbi:MAG TPA: DUF4226 domain-containing protein [Mycobacterium sp.]|nr:DUF4226 domain-containing protein [Mycobacterium sp.]
MEGLAAEAIRDAEASLARQQTVAAQIDLQVVTAVLNAHTDRDRGTGALERLQHDVETAVAGRPDLGTPAGARSFQRYLIGKLRDIRTVVDDAGLDATSQAALAAALSALYASSVEEGGEKAPESPIADLGTADPNPLPPEPLPADAAVPAAAAQSPAMPAWGSAAPASGGFPAMPAPSVPDLPSGTDATPPADRVGRAEVSDSAEPDAPVPDLTAAAPDLTNVITAAVAGTPIPEAFARQGITVPAAGSPVADPVEPDQLIAGDIGIFTDRHALALGNGKALLDNQIQPITAIGGPGFIGWQHPPDPMIEKP